VHWIPIFSRDDYFHVLADSLTYCSEHKGLQIHGYVIMPTHFHASLFQPDGKLSDVMRDMKKHTSKEIARKLKEDGRELWLSAMERAAGNRDGVTVWQEAFHPEQIHNESFFNQKLDYIHTNPVRAGYVDDPCDWKYSSAGFYYRETESIVPITPVLW
jgi:REP element-mobilizing transposase RayT